MAFSSCSGAASAAVRCLLLAVCLLAVTATEPVPAGLCTSVACPYETKQRTMLGGLTITEHICLHPHQPHGAEMRCRQLKQDVNIDDVSHPVRTACVCVARWSGSVSRSSLHPGLH